MLNKKILLIIVLTISLITVFGDSIFSSDQEFPFDMLVVSNHEVGSGGHRIISNIIESINEKYPTATIRAIPSGVEQVRAYMVRTGQTHTGFGATVIVRNLQEGTDYYGFLDWGPQPIRYLWISQSPGKGMAVRGDSDIYTYDDLRGRKVASFLAYPGSHMTNEAFLRFGGLTWDDVVPVDFVSMVEAYRAVKDGRIDACMYNIIASATYELEATHGIRWLENPADDKEAWERVSEFTPIFQPIKTTRGAGMDEPTEVFTEGYPVFWAYDFLDEDIAYWVVKAIHESNEYYAKRDPYLGADWDIDVFMGFWDAGDVPMHDGAIRYLKEIGYWTPEREQMNQNRLARQEELKTLWDSVVEEALPQKIAYKDFQPFWLEKREEAGF